MSVNVNLVVQTGVLSDGLALKQILQQALHKPISKYFLLTDQNVWKHHGQNFVSLLTTVCGLSIVHHVIEPGEQAKSREVKANLEDIMLFHKFTRDSCVLALGGGVIGDLAGFLASTYMRGIALIQIPTTVLAMVDSSIGGKTAIDTPHGKNLIGTFHQPQLILIDPQLLTTLPPREFANGFAEIIKTAAIRDVELFEILETSYEFLEQFRTDQKAKELLEHILRRTGELKKKVVEEDPTEQGVRCILNFGHTVGHAIETLLQPEILHGEAVSIGMVYECKMAQKLGHLSGAILSRIYSCCKAYRLPVKLPESLVAQDLFDKMALDKKNANNQIRCVILRDLGRPFETPVPVSVDVLRYVFFPQIMVRPAVQPQSLNVTLTVPGSKSLSNRVLPIAALGNGTVRIKGLLLADDTQVMLDALKELGVGLRWEENNSVLVVQGKSPDELAVPNKQLFLGNAGTASRFLTTLCTLVRGGECILTGIQRLKERPIRDLTTSLQANGCALRFLEREGHFPLAVGGPKGLPGGKMAMKASVSSQFVSSVLLSAPYATDPVELELAGEIVSQPFIDMTTQLMGLFGVSVERDVSNPAAHVYRVPLGRYVNPPTFTIEADASSASYPLALAAMTGGTVVVDSITSRSLQGDAKFFTTLVQMGCEASQTATFTKVTGPSGGRLRAIPTIDMSAMTDCFMTLAVLAAWAEGTTRIVNIANQRVKECNRLAAMVTELCKLGVAAEELEDGLQITGCAGRIDSLTLPAAIHCYNDHRIAMSFAVLSSRVPDITILDKECVDKTYPTFWLDLENVFKLQLITPEIQNTELQHKFIDDSKSVILIGMRGVGKTTLGRALATHLGWAFIDLDAAFEATHRTTILSYVASHSWPAFRAAESALLRTTLASHPSRTVISTGGGIVETDEGRKILKEYSSWGPNQGIVLQLSRPLSEIEEGMSFGTTRVTLGEPLAVTWARRKPLYEEVSNFEFAIPPGKLATEPAKVEKSLSHFVQRAIGKPEGLRGDPDTFFLSLTCGKVQEIILDLPRLVDGIHALELRVDMLSSLDPDSIKTELSLLRHHVQVPIIFTVRSKGQGGMWEGSQAQYFEFLALAKRLNTEFVDVEACWDFKLTRAFLAQRGAMYAIASYHDYQGTPSPQLLTNMFKTVTKYDADVYKVVGKACQISDNYHIHQVLTSLHLSKPTIAIYAGDKGSLSRVLNKFMTPVTHALLPVAAAPGQLTREQIIEMRQKVNFFDKEEYFLFGSPIQNSPSPWVHNKAFAVNNLPSVYGLCDTTSALDAVAVLRKPTVFGGSVTIPLKQAIIPHMDVLSPAASEMQAVNTVTKRNGKLYGDNTDWQGIYTLVEDHLLALRKSPQRCTALVIGAGGTAHAACYALARLGVTYAIYNRSPDRARRLATLFRAGICLDLSVPEVAVPDIVVSTVPPAAHFTLPPRLLGEGSTLVVELVYHPRHTPLLTQAQRAGCPIVEGVEVLLEQAFAQFEIWTQRPAPKLDMVNAVLLNRPDLSENPPKSFARRREFAASLHTSAKANEKEKPKDAVSDDGIFMYAFAGTLFLGLSLIGLIYLKGH